MKKTIPSILIPLLTVFALTGARSVIAGSCNSLMEKKAKTECLKDDTICQANQAENHELDNTVSS